jgi:hypothetical protein
MRSSVPFPNQQCAWRQVRSLLVQALQPVCHRGTGLIGVGTIQNLSGLMIEVAEMVGLDLERQNRKQKMPR